MKFFSKYKRLRITFKGSRTRMVDDEKEFVPGIQALFIDGFFDAKDEEMIKLLQAHPWYGIEFWSEGQQKDAEGNALPISIAQPSAEGLMQKNEEREQAEALVTACPKCPFKAKNKSGLMLHMSAKHPDSE